MRLRTQLVLASFLLAIVPLTAIVLYSYRSSRSALESAYRHEAARMTKQMDRRLSNIRGDLETKLSDLSALPLQTLPDATKSVSIEQPVIEQVVLAMGDIGPLVNAVEFQPEREVVIATANPNPNAEHPVAAPEPPEPVEAPEPIVIDLPQTPLPHFVLPPDYKQRIEEIRAIGKELGKGSALPEEQRRTLAEDLAKKNEELQKGIAASREQFEAAMKSAMAERARIREAQRASRTARRAADKAKDAAMQSLDAMISAPAAPAAPAPPAAPASPAPPAAVAAKPVTPAQAKTIRVVRKLNDKEKELVRERARQVALLLGHDFAVPVQKNGKLVGRVAAQVSPDEVIQRVLGAPTGDESEIAFAVDREGHLYTRNDAERAKLNEIGVTQRLAANRSLRDIANWIVVASNAGNGLRVGVARRVGEDLEELRRTARRNFGFGLMLVFVALVGIVPAANHMTRDVSAIAQGAERVAQGDLQTRVPVRSKNEFGQLAKAFNKMAHDLSEHQQRLFQEERARRDQEMQQRILAVEYDRKATELEEARRFQLSMLPKDVPHSDRFEVAVFIQTATEVGGDYYDFHVAPDGTMSVTIGDATGHGAKAGTMVTVIKTLFAGYSEDVSPAKFLSAAADKIKRMDLGRMAMALSVARFDVNKLTIASAGMPPVLIHRAKTNVVDEVALEATPLGTMGNEYEDRDVPVAPGDTVLFMSDGFPELTNAMGQQLGYSAAADAFASAASATTAQEVIDRVIAVARQWHGDQPPNDDMTFVAVRIYNA